MSESPPRHSRRSLVGLALIILLAMGGQQVWQSHRAGSIGDRMAALAGPGDIRLISATTCPSCIVARRWLQQHAVAYEECFIDIDAVCREEFEARRGMGTPLVVVRGQPQLGFSPDQVLKALER